MKILKFHARLGASCRLLAIGSSQYILDCKSEVHATGPGKFLLTSIKF
jgi:hypothetical protein